MKGIKLEKPEKCSMCDSTSLTYILQHEHPDTETDKLRKDNVWKCDTCECIHYLDGIRFAFEFLSTVTDIGRSSEACKTW
jgi:hypothetical protein